jgi:phage terminase large subunit-like protein
MLRSTLPLSEVARHIVIPEGIVTTAWPRVVDQCKKMGVEFDGWQHGVGSIALGKRANGKYAATVGGIVLSIPRQVGKTFLVGMILIALCIIFPGFTALWTAHRTKTATKAFGSFQGMVRRKRIWPHVLAIRTSNGEQEIRFRNRSVIMFGAREQGFGRGFDQVDAEVFDEAQILTEKALEDMVAAANQSRQAAGALLFFIGTPPRPIDPGEEFASRRDKALKGENADGKVRATRGDMLYVECSADRGADPDDRGQWETANPSYPDRTPVESMLRMREQLTNDASFLREALGIWDPKNQGGVIPRDSWDMCSDEHSIAADRFALGIEVAPDLVSTAVALGGQRSDGRWHVELDEHRSGSEWVPPYVAALVAANPQIRAVVGDVGGPLAALVDKDKRGRYILKGTQVVVTAPTVRDLGSGCANLLSGIVAASVVHVGQPQLTAAVAVAGKRALGDTGMWVFHRMSAASDITPVQAANLALIGAQSEKVSLVTARQRTGRAVFR